MKSILFLSLSLASAFAGALQPLWIPGHSPSAPTVVIVGGLNGPDASTAAVESLARRIAKARYNVYAIPTANPDREALSFPPPGTPYRQNGQSHFIWRWLGLHAPDLVVVLGDQDFGLATALSENSVAGVGKIPAIRTDTLPKQIAKSEAHIERDRRLARTPQQFAEELSQTYGHDFDQAVYIPAMALISRLRLGQVSDVTTLAAPYLDGRKDSLDKATGSHLAGHLLFAELAERTKDSHAIDRVRAAADLAFTPTGEMKEAMPMHSEMSDAVFMGAPILAAAGKLTGKTTYYDMAARHLRFMEKLCLRPDALYRHSPLNEAAWGRGNGFPALGMSWTLLNLPTSHSSYEGILKGFRQLIAALAKYQDADGMWHEVIDRPDSYAEFSATAMIATAMHRGVRKGWLDASYKPKIEAAWKAILIHSGPGGALLDVCESTGKQKSLEDYFNRAASTGKDARGGGMAMLLATELMEQ